MQNNRQRTLLMCFALASFALLTSAYAAPINLLLNMNTVTINTTSYVNATVLNGTGYYNITSAQCFYLNNASQIASFTGNQSWNESRANALYWPLTTVITNGTNGSNGATGATGPAGPMGMNGTNGTNGTNGLNGTNGTNGADGAQGIQGIQGIQGPTGATGPAGANGTNGTNATIANTTDYWQFRIAWANLLNVPFYNNLSSTFNATYDAKISYNQTWNETVVNARNYLTSYTETDPKWAANYTAFNTSWSTDNWNTTLQVKNAVNDTLNQYFQINANQVDGLDSTSLIQTTGGTMTGNLNVSNKNLTNAPGGMIKLSNSTGRASCIYANDTYSFIIDTTC